MSAVSMFLKRNRTDMFAYKVRDRARAKKKIQLIDIATNPSFIFIRISIIALFCTVITITDAIIYRHYIKI